MVRSNLPSPSKPAVAFHRAVLAQTNAAVAKWATENSGRFEIEAAAMAILQLLEPCLLDTDGDSTLDSISSIFEEFNEVLSPRLERQLAALAKAAFGLAVDHVKQAPRFPKIEVSLVGQDGNSFMILGLVGNALRAAQVSQDEIHEFYDEARRGDYNHLLQTVQSWVTVS